MPTATDPENEKSVNFPTMQALVCGVDRPRLSFELDVRQDKGMFRWNLQIGLRLYGIFVFGGSFRVLRINFLLLKVEDEFWMWKVSLNDLLSVSWKLRCLWKEFLILWSINEINIFLRITSFCTYKLYYSIISALRLLKLWNISLKNALHLLNPLFLHQLAVLQTIFTNNRESMNPAVENYSLKNSSTNETCRDGGDRGEKKSDKSREECNLRLAGWYSAGWLSNDRDKIRKSVPARKKRCEQGSQRGKITLAVE